MLTLKRRDCQLCNAKELDTVVDGATKNGPWAWMCPQCHNFLGCGIGIGHGQVYIWGGKCYTKMSG
jgi:hypothetical protein